MVPEQTGEDQKDFGLEESFGAAANGSRSLQSHDSPINGGRRRIGTKFECTVTLSIRQQQIYGNGLKDEDFSIHIVW